MNLRDYKKDVDFVVGQFVDDCLLFMTIHPDKAPEEVSNLVEKAVDVYNDFKDKASLKEIEGSKKAYFEGLRKELCAKVDGLYDTLSELIQSVATK